MMTFTATGYFIKKERKFLIIDFEFYFRGDFQRLAFSQSLVFLHFIAKSEAG